MRGGISDSLSNGRTIDGDGDNCWNGAASLRTGQRSVYLRELTPERNADGERGARIRARLRAEIV